MGARQRSGEGVVQRNGCPKGCFWRVRFFFAPLRFALDISGVVRANLKGAEKKQTLQKHPFGQPFLRTTPSPLLWRTLTRGVLRSEGFPEGFLEGGFECPLGYQKHPRLRP